MNLLEILDPRECSILTVTTPSGYSNYNLGQLRNVDLKFWETKGGKKLFNRLYVLTQLGFVRKASKNLLRDTENHIFRAEFLCLLEIQEQIVAYAVLNYWEIKKQSILYLSGMMIDPNYQGKNISSSLLKELDAKFSPDFLVARTQNPVMYQSIKKVSPFVLPDHRNGETHKKLTQIKQVGEFVAKNKLGMLGYNPNFMTGIATYGGPLYGVEPICKDTLIENWFKGMVNLRRGDSMIIVGTS